MKLPSTVFPIASVPLKATPSKHHTQDIAGRYPGLCVPTCAPRIVYNCRDDTKLEVTDRHGSGRIQERSRNVDAPHTGRPRGNGLRRLWWGERGIRAILRSGGTAGLPISRAFGTKGGGRIKGTARSPFVRVRECAGGADRIWGLSVTVLRQVHP